jgi:hypothetical protein
MRKIFIPLAGAAVALAVAAPASAQYYGAPAYGAPAYGAPHGNFYGHQRIGVRHWQQQLQQLRHHTRSLAAQGRLSRSQFRDMDRDIRSAERSLRTYARRGINQHQARVMEQRMARLHHQLARYASRNSHRYGYGYGRR